jgi:hypothetical protein
MVAYFLVYSTIRSNHYRWTYFSLVRFCLTVPDLLYPNFQFVFGLIYSREMTVCYTAGE